MSTAPGASCKHCGANLPSADSTCAKCAFGRLFVEDEASPEEDDGQHDTVTDDEDFDSGVFRLQLDLPGYQVGRYVARGGMGLVYQAEHLALNRTVALKVMASASIWSVKQRERFNVEAEAVAQLEHPNIVPVYDVGRWKGRPFIAMRWIDGETLDRWLPRRREELELDSTAGRRGVVQALPRQIIEALVTVSRAVHHAHQRGFLHRDLKPGNIMMDGNGTAYVMDFGLARRLDDSNSITVSGEVLGTPSFMSPEQARGDLRGLSIASDVFSLGAIVYWVLTGNAPFVGESTGEILKKIETEDPQMPSAIRRVHVDLETVCMKCLRKEPAARYASAENLAEDLERWLRGEPVFARRQSGVERLIGLCRRKPMVAGLAVLSLVLFVLFVVQLTVSNERFRIQAEDEASLRRTAEANEQLATSAKRAAQKSAELLADNVLRLRMEKAQDLLRVGRVDAGVASLAALVRDYPDVRAIQSRLIGALSQRNLRLPRWVFDLPENEIRGAVISPDGKRLAVARIRGVLELFDIETGRSLAVYDRAESFFSDLTVGPQGEWLIALSYGRIRGVPEDVPETKLFRARVLILDGEDLTEVMKPLETVGVGRVARMSPDRTRLAAQISGAKLWSIPDGKLLKERLDNRSSNYLKWSPDSTKFATLNRNQVGYLFDRDGQRLQKRAIGASGKPLDQTAMTGKGLRFRHVDRLGWAYTPNQAERVMTIGPGGTLEFWRSDNGSKFASTISRGDILCFDIHEKLIVTGERNGEITQRRMGLLNQTRLLAALGGPIVELDFSDDGGRLLASTGERTGGVAELIDPRGRRILGAGFRWHGMLVRNRELTRAATLLDSQKLGVFDLERIPPSQKERFLDEKLTVTDLIVSPTDDRFAAIAQSSSGRAAWLFNLPLDDKTQRIVSGRTVVFHPAGHHALVIKNRDVVRLENGTTTDLKGKQGEIRDFGRTPDELVRVRRLAHDRLQLMVGNQTLRDLHRGRGELWTAVDHVRNRLWTLDGDGAIEEIDLTTHETHRRHRVDLGGWIPIDAGLSIGGRWLHVSTAQAGLRVLSVDGNEAVTLYWASDEPIARHAFASGDKQLALVSTAGDTYLVNLVQGGKSTQIALLGSGFVDVAFTRGDSVVVTANDKNQIEFFDAATGLPVWEPVEVNTPINCVAATTDGSRVFVGTESGAWTIPMNWIKPAADAADWLPDLAEAATRMQFTERGRFYEMSWTETEAALQRAKGTAGGRLPDWANWMNPTP